MFVHLRRVFQAVSTKYCMRVNVSSKDEHRHQRLIRHTRAKRAEIWSTWGYGRVLA